MDEQALADRVGVLLGDFERLLQDLVGAEATVDKALDIADPVLDDLALLLQVSLRAGLAVPGMIVSTSSAWMLLSAASHSHGSHSCSQLRHL